MNWRFSVCVGAVGFAFVTVPTLGGGNPGRGGHWPVMLAISAAAGAPFGPGMRLLVPREVWRKKR